MAETWEAIVDGTTHTLNGGNLAYLLTVTGIGTPPVRRIKKRGPFQHGVSDEGYRLDTRIIRFLYHFQATTPALAVARRDSIVSVFQPTDTAIQLRLTRDDGSQRQIDGHMVNQIDFPNTPTQARIGSSQTFALEFECADPTFYDPTLRNVSFLAVSPSGFQVAIDIPWAQQTGSTIDSTEPITNPGTWDIFPTIYVTGPATGLVITNNTTNEKIDFGSNTIPASETWTITTGYGNQKVLDDDGTTRRDDQLSEDSDLVTWHLARAPIAPDGINSINVSVSSGATTATAVRMEYYDRYLST